MSLICLAYNPCPHHPHVYIRSTPENPEHEKFFCYACAQEARRATYAQQRAQCIMGQRSEPESMGHIPTQPNRSNLDPESGGVSLIGFNADGNKDLPK